MFIGTNVYGWKQLAQLADRPFDRRAAMRSAREAGLTGWEDAVRTPEEAAGVAEDAAAEGLSMGSVYVFGAFHDEAPAREATETALAIADVLQPHGVARYISNPDPLPEGALKSDAQLRIQRTALESLGRSLAERGAELLFHTHAPEMRAAAREFHHMLAATDPAAVRLCLDVHWIWRGAGNSMVALEDVIRLYGSRVSELHLRQSRGGVWDQSIGEGDIDLARVAEMLAEQGARPLLVIEHAYEDGTPMTMELIAAHAASVETVARLFGPIGA
ncbi:sugar phosphate isomerase/epimerase family protein [Histidinibacterium lentulum]|uniref:Sugar phosphate isomerase/epimerase n=1 Tax=Histidinibacterium lentulum TaxID=2480588 RepID=A0A3N2QTI9_9RHOB|nr:TIM barrel protein [Histidinibacterium lentulum]ROT98513.1 sugar phosphate isomerase/epimerase [Histidinibacterium lentulum]